MLALTFYRCIKSILYLLLWSANPQFSKSHLLHHSDRGAKSEPVFFWAIWSNICFAILFLDNNTIYLLLNLLSPSQHLFQLFLDTWLGKTTILGVRDKWPKSKYKNFKSTQWFSYKIRTKNSKEPIVYFYNWPLQEQHHFFKIQ